MTEMNAVLCLYTYKCFFFLTHASTGSTWIQLISLLQSLYGRAPAKGGKSSTREQTLLLQGLCANKEHTDRRGVQREEFISLLLLFSLSSHKLGRDKTCKCYWTAIEKNHVFCAARQGCVNPRVGCTEIQINAGNRAPICMYFICVFRILTWVQP